MLRVSVVLALARNARSALYVGAALSVPGAMSPLGVTSPPAAMLPPSAMAGLYATGLPTD